MLSLTNNPRVITIKVIIAYQNMYDYLNTFPSGDLINRRNHCVFPCEFPCILFMTMVLPPVGTLYCQLDLMHVV